MKHSAIGAAYALAGNGEEAHQILAELQTWLGRKYAVVPARSLRYMQDSGEREKALDRAGKSEQKELGALEFKCKPDWNAIRSHPCFVALVEKKRFDA